MNIFLFNSYFPQNQKQKVCNIDHVPAWLKRFDLCTWIVFAFLLQRGGCFAVAATLTGKKECLLFCYFRKESSTHVRRGQRSCRSFPKNCCLCSLTNWSVIIRLTCFINGDIFTPKRHTVKRFSKIRSTKASLSHCWCPFELGAPGTWRTLPSFAKCERPNCWKGQTCRLTGFVRCSIDSLISYLKGFIVDRSKKGCQGIFGIVL